MKSIPPWNPNQLLASPLFEPLQPLLSQMTAMLFPALDDFNHLLAKVYPPPQTVSLQSIKFVPQVSGKLGFEAQYEPRCYLSGEVQTRPNNWHDLFNALVWLTFPKAKAAINARHYQALSEALPLAPRSSQRGAVRDVHTLFDESGVIVPYVDDQFANLLRDFKWHELFWVRRQALPSQMSFYIFGHGLYEKAMQPYIGLTGQGLLLPVPSAFFTWPLAQRLIFLDAAVAKYLSDANRGCDTRELTPVPLLGIPGWSLENETPLFYENKKYFRESRRAR